MKVAKTIGKLHDGILAAIRLKINTARVEGLNNHVLIATKAPAWRQADKPDADKLLVLARVNRGELSLREAGDLLGVSYTWVRDMTKRYFGKDGHRVVRTADPSRRNGSR